ncbi:MAG TPA: DnaD domain protein [Candidatus Pullichristensenella stercoripullorum]|nr:DnaD domain protein [Candidatus Pullichristensenella stercoripullorum]
MAFLSFDHGAVVYGATPVENMFLLEYLPVAPDDCLRVYLYARLLCCHPELGGSVSDVARALRLTDEAVEDAFRFWEREGLVKRLTDRPPTYALLPMRGAASASEMDQQYYQFRDFNASLQRLFGDVILHGEVAIPQEWVTVFGYTVEAALKIVEYGLTVLRLSRRTPRATLRKLDNVAREWSERGARTLADVERMIAEKSGDMRMAEAVLKRFGLRRRPTEDELALARKWRGWGFDTEAVLAACGETTKASNPSFAYVDRVLEGRYLQTDANFAALRDVLRELGASALPTPETLKRYAAFLEAGFEAATVTAAAIALNAQNRHRFEDLERLLTQWAEKGLFRADAAEAYLQRQRGLQAEMIELLRLAGSDRTPGLADIALFEGWKARFSPEMLHLAAEQARGKGAAVGAIDKLLAAWEKEGVSTPEQARARRERPAKGFDNPALHYEQRPLAGDGGELFTDLSKYRGNGE